MEHHPDLGITVHRDGDGSTEVSGRILHYDLDENSYLKFGFTDPAEDIEEIGLIASLSLSSKELKDYEDVEVSALKFFSSDEFAWFNSSLYGSSTIPEGKPDDPPYFHGNRLQRDAKHSCGYNERTRRVVNEISEVLDSALKKAPHKTRTLWRGISGKNPAIKGIGASAWVDENVSLGQEMVFDGYQSTSMSKNVGFDFTPENGLVYEIMTPEGVNITSISEWTHEEEVLLPRESRYMVVGVHRNVEQDWTNTATVIQLIAIDEKGFALNSVNHKK